MRLSLLRFASSDDATLGAIHIDGRFGCFALEDQAQVVKISSETRIPAGLYQIKLRTDGGMSEKYKSKFPEHKGMLWLRDVPGFEWIYIHVGNTDDHTAGCILVGDVARVNFQLDESTTSYRRLYGQVVNAIQAGETVEILIEDGTK